VAEASNFCASFSTSPELVLVLAQGFGPRCPGRAEQDAGWLCADAHNGHVAVGKQRAKWFELLQGSPAMSVSIFPEPSDPQIQPHQAQCEARGGVVLPKLGHLSIPEGKNKFDRGFFCLSVRPTDDLR